MTGLIDRDGGEGGVDLEVPGTTFVLTELGWEAAEYTDPEEDWSTLEDGSYLSPDGTTRTWPLAGSEPP